MTDYFLYDETVKKKRHKKKVLITWLMIMIAVNIAIFGYLYYVTYVDRGYVSVNFIDVKQGDSSFINTPKGNHILIDGGDVSFGKGAVKQFMVSRGIHDLDVAFVTHCHEDHATGIIELIESGFSIKKVCVHGSGDHNDLGKRLLKVASEHGVEVEFLKVGDVLEFDDVTMTILAPENMFIEKGKVDENESSLVIRMDYAKNSVLFTGDIENKAEKSLLNNPNLDVDILKVGHHGSKTSSSLKFIEEVSPKFAIVSVGEDNKYGLPDEEALANIQKSGAEILRTDFEGDIEISIAEKGITKIKKNKKKLKIGTKSYDS